jgi:hypothetical protein
VSEDRHRSRIHYQSRKFSLLTGSVSTQSECVVHSQFSVSSFVRLGHCLTVSSEFRVETILSVFSPTILHDCLSAMSGAFIDGECSSTRFARFGAGTSLAAIAQFGSSLFATGALISGGHLFVAGSGRVYGCFLAYDSFGVKSALPIYGPAELHASLTFSGLAIIGSTFTS